MAEQRTASLFSLPQEIREHIYRFCFSHDYCRVLEGNQRPPDPPLTRVSKALRDETLRFYCAEIPLFIRIRVNRDSYGSVWLKTNPWYEYLPPSRINWTRSFVFRFLFAERYFGEPVTIELGIKLHERTNDFTMKHSFGPGWYTDVHRKGDPADCEEMLLVLKGHLEASLKTSINDIGIGHFTASDIDRLTSVDSDKLP